MSLAVYGLAQWQPFAADAPAAADTAGGDPASGQAVFARACATCHGGQAEGGVGPALAGSGLSADDVAAVVASGRGIMPAGLVTGDEAADVSAFVAQVSGGGAAPGDGAAARPGGTAAVTGPRLSGLVIALDEPAPGAWGVWIEGPAGRLRAGTIDAGEGAFRDTDVDGGRTLLGRFDTVIVGSSADDPVLSGAFAQERIDDLLALLVDDPRRAEEGSALDAAAAQVAVLRDHVRFLAAARDEDNLANVRFHGEHMVNITRGDPLQDIDGNGDVSNPGDGVGLIDGPGAHLRRVGLLIGPALSDRDREAAALATVIARDGEVAGSAGSVTAAAQAIAEIERADARLAVVWAQLRRAALTAAVVELQP
ncbi:MAG: cytochrome c [Thermoleophilia bacterium]|nr:cytochrome c [Thermoleophilia bacterium]